MRLPWAGLDAGYDKQRMWTMDRNQTAGIIMALSLALNLLLPDLENQIRIVRFRPPPGAAGTAEPARY